MTTIDKWGSICLKWDQLGRRIRSDGQNRTEEKRIHLKSSQLMSPETKGPEDGLVNYPPN